MDKFCSSSNLRGCRCVRTREPARILKYSFMGRDSSVSNVPGCKLNRWVSIPMPASSEFHWVGNGDTFFGHKRPQHEVCHSPFSIMLRPRKREALLSRLFPGVWPGREMNFVLIWKRQTMQTRLWPYNSHHILDSCVLTTLLNCLIYMALNNGIFVKMFDEMR